MADSISNAEDVIDSRDVIARIEELQETKAALEERRDEANASGNPAAMEAAEDALADWLDSEEGEELEALLALQEEAEGYAPDWQYGETLIRDSYFKEYAQELAEEIGAVNFNATWPNSCIDWDQAARELRMDYTAVDFDGVTYWVR